MRTLPQNMVQKMALVLILLFSDPGNGNSFGSAVITDPPVDTTGCYGGISTFYCESNRSDVVAIGWLIGTNIVTEQIKETHGITINNDNSLSIMGLPINNNIRIGCIIVVSTPPYVETMSATFTVIEIPSVENLNVVINNDIMTCTWSQPSCVPVNYDYHVNINNESLIVTNTTTIQYTVSYCQSYNVSVTVMDTIQPQYQSDTVTRTGFIGVLDIQLAGSPLVTFRTINECDITVPLKINLTSIPSCPIMLSETFTQLLPPSNNTVSYYTLTDRLMSFNTTTGTGWFYFGSYNETLKGNLLVSLQTDAPSNTLDFNISTFNVQNFSITPLSDSTTDITCVFAIDSFADGCNVVFTSNNITKYNITIPKSDKDNATNNTHIINGHYDVDVYDVMNGVTGQYPAYIESDIVHITHYIDRPSTTDSSTAAIAPSITTMSLSSSISSSIEPTVAATNPVTNTGSSPDYIVIGCSIGGAIVLLLLIVIVTGLLVFKIKCVRYENGNHSLRVRSEQALVRKPRANQHNYVDPVAIRSLRTQSPFIHNNEESEYFQHPSTFLQGARRNSSPPPPPPTYPPPTFPPPDYNQINETEFSHPYTVTEDIHESSTSNDYISHTTFVSQQLLPTQDTSTTNGSTDNSSIPTESIKSPSTSSSEISNSTNQQLVLEAVNKFNFEQRSNEPSILRPHNAPVAPLPKPIVRVPEGPKLQESLYAELQLEGYQRPFQRIPEDPVAYLLVTKKDANTLPPIPPKPQQQQSIDIVQETHKGNSNVNRYTNDDNDHYTTEPVVASDTESDHVIVMDKLITIGGSVEDIDGTRTSTVNPTSVVVTGMPVWKFSTNNCQIVCSTFIKEHSFSETDNDIITMVVPVLHETSTSGFKKDQLVINTCTLSQKQETKDQESVYITPVETEKESKYSKYDKPRNNNNVIRQFIDWAGSVYSVDWTTGLDYWTGLLDYNFVKNKKFNYC